MIKKRYDKLVSNSTSLRRIFSSPITTNKYPTLSKYFTPPAQTVLFDHKQTTANLDVLDQLVNQALLARANSAAAQTSTTTSSRAKELLNQVVVEPPIESVVGLEPKTEHPPEFIANPELRELSQEIKEVSKESQEQREQALIKEKQQEINNLATEAVVPVAVSNQPVVVLPITTKSKEEARFKSTKYSVRWLLEWCQKIAKMFAGAVVYKEEVDYE